MWYICMHIHTHYHYESNEEQYETMFVTGRMPRSGKLPVLFLLTGQKSGFSRCTDSGQTLQDRRAPGSAWLCKISRQSVRRSGNNIKNFHFLVKSRPQGRLPWPISKILGGFYAPDYPTLVFQISCDSLHRLRSYCGEIARR